MRNPHLLFPCRFFIKDLFHQLQQQQQMQQPFTPLRVYRSQLVSSEELDVLMSLKGHIISMNSFLSTTLNKKVALFFLGDLGHARDDELCPVLLEIDLQPCSDNRVPIADISGKSEFSEEEVLIMLNALFRIQNLTYDSRTAIWVVQMSFCNSDDPYLQQMPQYNMIASTMSLMSDDHYRDLFFFINDPTVKFMYDRAKEQNALVSPHDECTLS